MGFWANRAEVVVAAGRPRQHVPGPSLGLARPALAVGRHHQTQTQVQVRPWESWPRAKSGPDTTRAEPCLCGLPAQPSPLDTPSLTCGNSLWSTIFI